MEVWIDIVGFEGLYQISNYGVVRSYPKECKVKNGGIQKRPRKNLSRMLDKNSGLYRTTLRKDGKNYKLYINRLVAEHFVDNPDNKKTVKHKNGIKTDNRSCNILWN